MPLVFGLYGLLLAIACLAIDGELRAQEDEAPPTASAPSAAVPGKGEKEPLPPKLPKSQVFTKSEIQKECEKYEGKFIGYYDQVFKVESCKRREILSSDDDQNPIMIGKAVVNVDSLTVAKIPAGASIGGEKPKGKPECQKFEGRYILSRGDEVFFIENCRKNLIPDWDTYVEHSQKRGKRGLEIIEVSEGEYHSFPNGKNIKSVLDEEYKKLLDADKGVDIIPLAEACKGINGTFVSYYSRIYRIEGCRKQPVDAEIFLQKNPGLKMTEMSSEQWVSIPTGKEYKFR